MSESASVLGFAPDANPLTNGVLLDCQAMVPYDAGMKGAPSAVTAVSSALASEARGAVVATKLDGTRRVFAGTQTKLYELTGSSWTDRSAGTYTGSSESRWSFCQFGDTTVASNLVDAMQSSSAGAFAAIAGAPKAKIVVSASNNFVIAFNTNDGTYGSSPDRWWCCAQNDQTNWTPAVSTLATTGRLVATEGAIQAALPLGGYVVAYKQKGIYLGSFVGSPVVWQWDLIPGGEAGAVGQEAVCDIGGAHFIVSNDNFWLFDGTRPVPIGTGIVRDWFLTNSSATYRYRTKAIYDKQSNLVRVFFPSTSSTGACDFCIAYHVVKKQWGRDDRTIQAPLNYISPGVTIDGMDAYASTINALPNIPVDSQFWLSGGQAPSVFNGSNQLVSLTGVCGSSSWTTSDMGDDEVRTNLNVFRPRYAQTPTTASAQGYAKNNEGDALTAIATSQLNDGKFDLRQDGRYHRVTVTQTGDNKVLGYAPRLLQSGMR